MTSFEEHRRNQYQFALENEAKAKIIPIKDILMAWVALILLWWLI